jgi:hypothetical protein
MSRIHRRTAHLFTQAHDNVIIARIKHTGAINLAESFDDIANVPIFAQAGILAQDVMTRYYHKLRNEVPMFRIVSEEGITWTNRKVIRRVL